MTDEPAPARRRRRRAVWRAGAGIARTDVAGGTAAGGTAAATASTLAPSDDVVAAVAADVAVPTEPVPAPPPAASRRRRGDPAERGLRDLVGAGPSQLTPTRAMRARDANRPSEADLAASEQEVVIVRRHWQPPNA